MSKAGWRCPVCNAEVERFRYWLEDPEAGTFERMIITRWLPCGHESSPAKSPTSPVRPDVETT